MGKTIESGIAGKFKMDDKTWMRHANPWSVYTKITVLPFLIFAIWSRVWLGWWSLILFIIAIAWTWYNPRIFPEAKSTDNWASRGVFGERVWANRENISIPEHHRIMPNILSGAQVVGIPFLVWGLWQLAFWPTLVGLILIEVCKLWFVDRMVCIYEDMKHIPEYGKWKRKKEDLLSV